MKRVWSAARILVFGFIGTAFAAPFQNGSFELGTPTADPCNIALPVGSTAITGWTVISGNIDYITTCWTSSNGARSLDLVGTGNIGGIRQTFDTVSGGNYQVSFDLAGNYGLAPVVKPLSVTVAGVTNNYTFDTTGKSALNMGWVTRTFTFTATGSTSTIDFVSNLGGTGNFAGAALDNVSVARMFALTSVGLFPSANPSAFGSSVTFTVQVQGTVGSPTGTMAYTDNGSPIPGCTAVPLGPTGSPLIATADCVTSTLAIGNHTIAAVYSGDVVNAGSSTTVSQVVNAVPLGGAPWVGAAGSVTNPGFGPIPAPGPYPGTTIPSSPTVLNDGTSGQPAVFTYQTVNSFCCHTGDWTFETPVTAVGDVPVNWTYSGYHGTCSAMASLTPYIRRLGVTTYGAPLYNQADNCTGLLPNGGFGDGGQVVFQGLVSGDSYGFTMHASNFDLNGGVGGMLTVTTGILPTTTALGSTANPATPGNPITFTATVTGSAPIGGHVTFTQEGREIQGCRGVLLGFPSANTAACVLPAWFGPPPEPRAIRAIYSGDSVNAGSVSPALLQATTAAPPAFASPTLVRAIAGPSSTYLIARADTSIGAPTTFTVDSYKASSCNGGALVGGSLVSGGTFVVSTDPDGYFAITIPGVVSGNFVALQPTSFVAGMSACIASSGDNDYWPKALDFGANPALGDYIDTPGKARWYKFSITPGQKVQVVLSVPADYDIVVFKDINQAFLKQLAPTNTAELTRLNAEFAPSTFSPSTFSPSTFSPSTFSPDAFAPSTFSPSTFSPSTFSPSTFSPSTFSPSTFSPSTFSPSTFSPSTFSPSTFSPSTFSPSTFSPNALFGFTPTEVNQAFSSAQTRSIIGVSATPGTGNELVQVNTWNDTGDYYVRVAGRGAAFSTTNQFTLSVAKGATSCTGVTPLAPNVRPTGPANINTVILTDSTKVALNTLVSGVTLQSKLQAFAARTDIKGAIVDVAGDARVNTLKLQAAARTDCPYATNLVAEEIKTIVDSYRGSHNPGLRYVVIVGNDGAIPFFRYPDETLIGQESNYDPPVQSTSISAASLAQDYVLSQDAYGASTRIAMRSVEFPIPGLAVGRVIETPAEIAGLIDAYTAANGVINPTTSLVTGYDFLADAANSIKTELQTGIGTAPQTLITPNLVAPQDPASWTATQLSSALFGSRHDVIFLAGHFSANSALAADFSTTLLTTELAASTTNFTNSIVFSAGCHAGYNIVDGDAIPGVTVKLDWAQAFAQKQATLIAGTGYQYGDTDFIEYSERLYQNFARQLRAGTPGTAISVGEALNRAKLDYLAVTPDVRGIHQKAVLEATVFGLPMLSVNMPGLRSGTPSGSGAITPTLVPAALLGQPGYAGYTLGLNTAPLSLAPTPGPQSVCLKNPPYDTAGVPPAPCPAGYTEATWLNGTDGVVSNPVEPVLPLYVANVTPTTNVVLRGVGFRGGSYTDTTTIPLTGAPATEIRGVHTSFSSPVLFPMRLWTPNYFGALSSTVGTRLLVTPVQHRAADLAAGTSIRRQFSNLDLKLYYSGNITANALAAAPTIVSVNATSSGGVTFAAQVVGAPTAAIHEVWVTYTADSGPSGTWASVSLEQCGTTPQPAVCGTTTDTQVWMGQPVSPPANGKYIVQAVNGVGLVSLDDNLGAYYAFTASAGGPTPAAGTTLALVSPPTTITYGATPLVTASLASGPTALGGRPLTFSVAGTAKATTTGAGGAGSVNLALAAPGNYQIVASYAGEAGYLPSTTSSPITINPAPTSFVDDSITAAPAAFLYAAVGANPQRAVAQELVMFSVAQNGGVLKNILAYTDLSGRVALPATGLPIGTYSVTAAFAGNELYLGTTAALGNLQVTTPCPLGQGVKVRWHYKANGSPGNWAGDKQTSCANGVVAFAVQALEGNLSVAPGTTINFGYALQLPGNKTHFNALVANAKAVFQAQCASGAAPSPSTFTLTIPGQIVLLDSPSWNPSSNKNDPATYQGTGTVPDLCAGGQVKLNQGGTFSATVTLN